MSPLEFLTSLDGVMFGLRWMHFFAGIIWIGLLYYFNFVQTPFFAEAEAPVRSGAVQKLVPRALWWFRWGAFWTALTGIAILAIVAQRNGAGFMQSAYGVSILSGGVMALIMALNVWFVIWPNQKIVIANAVDTAAGKAANPAAAGAGARAGVASRTNVLFSLPMLFFMGAASHFNYAVTENSNTMGYWIAYAVIVIAIEANALKGKLGPMATVKGVITCAFGVTVVLVGLLSALM